MSITRERALQILDRNAKKFAEHTEEIKAMAAYHVDRMEKLNAHTERLGAHGARLDAHQDILYRGFFGRLKWIVTGY